MVIASGLDPGVLIRGRAAPTARPHWLDYSGRRIRTDISSRVRAGVLPLDEPRETADLGPRVLLGVGRGPSYLVIAPRVGQQATAGLWFSGHWALHGEREVYSPIRDKMSRKKEGKIKKHTLTACGKGLIEYPARRATMSNDAKAETSKRFRSPHYPAIPLGKAIERAGQLHTKALHHSVGVSVLADAWEFGAKSSGLWATAAALLQFGLLTDEGSGDKRKFQLTEGAIRIIRDPNPESAKRRSAIRAAAVSPKIFKELWDKFGLQISTISDVVLKSWLTVDRHEAGLAPYSDAAADEVIRVYRATVAFAGLTESANLPEDQWEMDATIENDLASVSKPKGEVMEQPQVQEQSGLPAPPIRVLMNGDRLSIQASVDLEGLKKLQEMLTKYQSILEMMRPDKAEGKKLKAKLI